jgi:Fe-Mn family superoxide dismutase
MMTRRELLGTGAAVLATTAMAQAQPTGKGGGTSTRGDAFMGQHAPKPLPFDPKKLAGLSEKLIVSHHDKNYAGAVKNLNKVEEQLAQIGPDTAGFVVTGLELAKLQYTNSMILHEAYFGNLGGDGKAAGSATEKEIVRAYGSYARFEELFRALGMGLAGGSGWAILDWDFHAGGTRIYWAGDHTRAVAFGSPLLVLDMFEHAYAMDYGADAKQYVDAFMKNINWHEVEKRLARAQKAQAALKA